VGERDHDGVLDGRLKGVDTSLGDQRLAGSIPASSRTAVSQMGLLIRWMFSGTVT